MISKWVREICEWCLTINHIYNVPRSGFQCYCCQKVQLLDKPQHDSGKNPKEYIVLGNDKPQ